MLSLLFSVVEAVCMIMEGAVFPLPVLPVVQCLLASANVVSFRKVCTMLKIDS